MNHLVFLMAPSMGFSSQNKRQGDGSPVSRKRLESASRSKLSCVQAPEKEPEADTESQDTQESQLPGNAPLHPE